VPPTNPTVESSKLGKPNEDVLTCPKELGAGQWCYENLKRSKRKVRVEAAFTTEAVRRREFSRLQDCLKQDSLLTCAVVKVEDSVCAVTFGNGSVVTLKPIRST
jgi:hypothetical protein